MKIVKRIGSVLLRVVSVIFLLMGIIMTFTSLRDWTYSDDEWAVESSKRREASAASQARAKEKEAEKAKTEQTATQEPAESEKGAVQEPTNRVRDSKMFADVELVNPLEYTVAGGFDPPEVIEVNGSKAYLAYGESYYSKNVDSDGEGDRVFGIYVIDDADTNEDFWDEDLQLIRDNLKITHSTDLQVVSIHYAYRTFNPYDGSLREPSNRDCNWERVKRFAYAMSGRHLDAAREGRSWVHYKKDKSDYDEETFSGAVKFYSGGDWTSNINTDVVKTIDKPMTWWDAMILISPSGMRRMISDIKENSDAPEAEANTILTLLQMQYLPSMVKPEHIQKPGDESIFTPYMIQTIKEKNL